MSNWSVRTADSLKYLSRMKSGSVQTVITDPPYGIGIADEAWDRKDIAVKGTSFGSAFEEFTFAWASQCFRLLPPGGHLLAFSAPRMSHHLTTAVERAGFEIREPLLWAFGTGMVKSRLYGGGQATGIKPAFESILLARRPLDGTVQQNLRRHGTGTLQVREVAQKRAEPVPAGLSSWRWPVNLLLSHHADCGIDGCAEECPRALIDRQSPGRQSSRIFYCPKTASVEREAGLDGSRVKVMKIYDKGGTRPRRNFHPTVKPVALMRWLTKLAAPPGSLVLDPFTGSGTTGIAATLEGRQFIGVEKNPEYAWIARRRIEHWACQAEANR